MQNGRGRYPVRAVATYVIFSLAAMRIFVRHHSMKESKFVVWPTKRQGTNIARRGG